MLDAAQAEKDRRNNTGGGSIGSGLEFGMVLGRNATGKGLIPGQPAVADGFIQAPDDSVNPFKVVLRIMAPVADDLRPMVVSVDGCDSGAIGRFRVTGPAIVKMATLPGKRRTFCVLWAGWDSAAWANWHSWTSGSRRDIQHDPAGCRKLWGASAEGDVPDTGH